MISIYTEKLPDGWRWSPLKPPPSGTVEFYINIAEQLAKFGYDVCVYYDGESLELNDVYYLPRELYVPSDINIHCNHRAELGEKNIFWNSMTGIKADDYMDYDHRIVLSKYHQSIFGDSEIIGLGVQPNLFKPTKKENICLYSSSPDRGGEYISEKVINDSGYRLIKTYAKGISEEEMIELYNRAKFWLHPCQGVELFCVAAVKAQTAGCIPVVVPNMALDETVKYGIKTSIEYFNRDLEMVLKNPPKPKKYCPQSWESVGRKIEKLF